uniref:F-box domain-containing protein n=1 Tax=Spongospora subterranea TaxID=70186 RepID=A0A0H5QJX5_9EUKA|eukprot:CRZ02400.1 hypothetical protein [Spongospora subterranea]
MDLLSTLAAVSYSCILRYLEPRVVIALSMTCRHLFTVMSKDDFPIWQQLYDLYSPEGESFVIERISRKEFLNLSKSFIIRHIDYYGFVSDIAVYGQTPLRSLSLELQRLGRLDCEGYEMPLICDDNFSHVIIQRRNKGLNSKQRKYIHVLASSAVAADVFEKGDIFRFQKQFQFQPKFQVIETTWLRFCQSCSYIGTLFPYRSISRKSPCHRSRPLSHPSDPDLIDNLFPNIISNLRNGLPLAFHYSKIDCMQLEMEQHKDMFAVFQSLETSLSKCDSSIATAPARVIFENLWRHIDSDEDYDFREFTVFHSERGYIFQNLGVGGIVSEFLCYQEIFRDRDGHCADDYYFTLHDLFLDLDEYLKEYSSLVCEESPSTTCNQCQII